MSNLQRLISDIRQACAQVEAHNNKQLADLAQQYAKHCEAINARLSRCSFYLRQGFRGEAIRCCELEPNLLEVVNELIFPEQITWIDIASQLGISTPQLLQDLAVELNEAYGMHSATKELAAHHRLQNVLRRPAEERLATLTKLREIDPYCASWQQNIDRLQH